MRMLSLAYMRDQFAKQVDRVNACVLRCEPHEWSVLVDAGTLGARRWKYAGRFDAQPEAKQLEQLLQSTLSKLEP